MSLSAPEFDYLCSIVRQQSAMVLEAGKEYLAEARLLPLAQREGFGSLRELVARLRTQPPSTLHRRVVEAMTINETWFFRDLHPFEALQRMVLPALLAARGPEHRLTVWCAACSSGQEPYSIAMLMREHFPAIAYYRLRLLASDLSTEILTRARAGRYLQLEVNRGLPAALLVKYFRKEGGEWQIADEVRRMVEFQVVNLAESWPYLSEVDIIFMRNVLIYFDVATKKEILARVRKLLRPDGCLFLGGAETTLNLDEAFERLPYDRAGCYRLRH